MTLQQEYTKRQLLLAATELDTKAFGFLTTFFLYDEIVSNFNWLGKKLYDYGFLKLAIYVSSISINQRKNKYVEIRQIVGVVGKSSTYIQDGFVHDKDPENDKAYLCKKYNLIA